MSVLCVFSLFVTAQALFVSSWETDSQITLPVTSTGTYDMIVDWGDGTADIYMINSYDQDEVTHTYSTNGTYTITINGTILGWRFNNGDKEKLLDISQ